MLVIIHGEYDVIPEVYHSQTVLIVIHVEYVIVGTEVYHDQTMSHDQINELSPDQTQQRN